MARSLLPSHIHYYNLTYIGVYPYTPILNRCYSNNGFRYIHYEDTQPIRVTRTELIPGCVRYTHTLEDWTVYE